MRENSRRVKQVLRLIGLAARAGRMVPGTDRVRIAVRRDELQFVIVADDASANAREKLLPLLAARRVPYRVSFTRAELGEAVGRSYLSAIGLTDASLAGRIRELIGESGVQE